MQQTVRKHWRNPISNVNCPAPSIARKYQHSKLLKVAQLNIYHCATKGMMHIVCMYMETFNTCYTLHGKTKNLRKTRCKIRANLSIDQFSIWLKHCYAVNCQFSAPILLNFSILGSKLPLRPILRPTLCGHPYGLCIAPPLNRFTRVESIQPGFQVLSNGHAIQRTRFNWFQLNRRRPVWAESAMAWIETRWNALWAGCAKWGAIENWSIPLRLDMLEN